MWALVLSVFASLLAHCIMRINQARGHGTAGVGGPNLNVWFNRLGVFIGWIIGGFCFVFHLGVNSIVWVHHLVANLNSLANRMVCFAIVAWVCPIS